MPHVACTAAGRRLKHGMKQDARSEPYRSAQEYTFACSIAQTGERGNGLRPVLPQEGAWEEGVRSDHSAVALVLAICDGR